MLADKSVDLLYLACNRLEFTRETFLTLLENTDWRYVGEFFVYDDGSQDGTREWLAEHCARAPVSTRLRQTRFGSPVTAMTHFIKAARAPILAKTDNDAMLPPDWLRQSLEVFAAHPELTLLGIEAMYPHNDDRQLARSYVPAQFISGLGLYRREAFARSQPAAYRKWFGLEEWQLAQGSGLIRGWINPALPVFLLDRFPGEPWRSYSAEYVRRRWQRAWPKYDPSCTLWHWRWPAGTDAAPSYTAKTLPPGNPHFLCAMRVKNEAAHIHEVIARVLPLCQKVFVFDDHSTDATPDICRSFGESVTVFPSPFSGLDEARDKNYLLAKIIAAAPEWVLWIDGDEVLELSGPEQIKRAVASSGGRVASFYLKIAYLWDDTQRVRVDGIFGRFNRSSLFRLAGQPITRLHFPARGSGSNFHCGNVPQGLIGGQRALEVRLKHYGYMTREQRLRKYHWYNANDPHNQLEDQYRHLAEISGARFAPGPPSFIPWTE